ncbi:hypothetical protein [Lentzea cavernae]|uniref:Serine/threonine protein kinase n=1 Tax=Lentzea cavernae TaxID=2020703 RepID=A0ABQ3MSG0_9PSEU|nr:hypothetical protein [Lentzea cavernae]GHH59505.1 hypothetical protein GCM10017774_82550 [Lentzea cavernae]
MRGIWHVLGALGVVTALAYARDVADPVAVAGTPVPLSIESMRAIADDACERPPGYRAGTLQMHRGSVLEVGVTAGEFVVCTVDGGGRTSSAGKAGAPGAEYFNGRTGLVWDDGSVEAGRVAPEVAVLEFVLPSGKVVKAELHGDVYLCRVPEKITFVRVRAYDAGGRLLRDAVI